MAYRPMKPQASVARAAVYQMANAGYNSSAAYPVMSSHDSANGPDVQNIQHEDNLTERAEEIIAVTKVEQLIESVAQENKEYSEQESDA
ncbi:hypothetical protein EJB05_43662, partial [Eragrostis curvula]